MKNTPKKFEIQVFEADYTDVPDNQPPKWRPLMYQQNMSIIVSSKDELTQLQRDYMACDQRFKIIREIPMTQQERDEYKAKNNIKDDPDEEGGKAAAANEKQSQCEKDEDKEDCRPKGEDPSAVEKSDTPPADQKQDSEPDADVCVSNEYKSKPKFYHIGGIDIKNDNGAIYQKQWVRLSNEEASNFRIVNDKNNMVVNLIGKHLEARKWILVEDSGNDL